MGGKRVETMGMQEVGMPDRAGRIQVDSVSGTKVIVVDTRGIPNVAGVDRHFAALARTAEAIRAETGEPLHVIVALHDRPVSDDHLAERVRHWTRQIYRPDDRVAFIVASNLLKQQRRAMPHAANREIFVSADAARTWLLAHRVSVRPNVPTAAQTISNSPAAPMPPAVHMLTTT